MFELHQIAIVDKKGIVIEVFEVGVPMGNPKETAEFIKQQIDAAKRNTGVKGDAVEIPITREIAKGEPVDQFTGGRIVFLDEVLP